MTSAQRTTDETRALPARASAPPVSGVARLVSVALLPERLLSRARADRLVAILFRALAVILLLNLHWLYLGGQVNVLLPGYAAILAISLLLILLAGPRCWPASGLPTRLLAATLAMYLLIGLVPFALGAAWEAETTRHILRQLFFFAVFLAATLGARAMLARSGPESLLRELLHILCASCLFILATPLLRDFGVLALSRLPMRLAGAFTHVNDAGMVACATVALATALLARHRHDRLVWLALVLGYATGWASLSRTVVYAFAVLAILALLTNRLGRKQPAFRWLLIPGLIGFFLHPVEFLYERGVLADLSASYLCSSIADNPGLGRDCAILLDSRDTLAGDAVLNWDESLSILYWEGVDLGGSPTRVLALNLPDRELNGRIPPRLGQLDQLTALRLQGNRLAGPIPPELDRIWFLRDLLLAGNELSGSFPPELETLKFLQNVTLPPSVSVAAPDFGSAPETAAPFPGQDLPAEAEVAATLIDDGLDSGQRSDPQEVSLETVLAASLSPEMNAQGNVTAVLKGERVESGYLYMRLTLWQMALERILASPVIGNGFGKFLYMEGATTNYQGHPSGVHNLYLGLLGEAGFLPLLLYCAFLLSLLRLLWSAPASPARDSSVTLAVIMAIFSMTFHHLLTLGAFVFLAGVAGAFATQLERAGLRPWRETLRKWLQPPGRSASPAAQPQNSLAVDRQRRASDSR